MPHSLGETLDIEGLTDAGVAFVVFLQNVSSKESLQDGVVYFLTIPSRGRGCVSS